MADNDKPSAGSMQQGEQLEGQAPAPKRARTEQESPPATHLRVDVVVDENVRAIVANGQELWNAGMIPVIQAIDGSERKQYKETRDSLLDEHGRLKEDAVVEEVLAVSGVTDEKGTEEGRRIAVQLANLECCEPSIFGEMFLQQCVYNRLAEVLFTVSMALNSDGSMYAADQAVGTASFVKTVAGPKVALECTPDAAIRMHPTCYCLAMMEIKTVQDPPDPVDMSRCVLMLSASALALRELLGDEALESELGFPCFFPFVIGSGMIARLYCVRLGKDGSLQVVKVSHAVMQSDSARIGLTADLLALLLPLVRLRRKFAEEIQSGFIKVSKQDAELNLSSLKSRSHQSDQRSTNKQASSEDHSKNQSGAQAKLASLARFSRIRPYDLRSRSLSSSSRHKSRYYFLGDLDDRTVFCKVWRDGDYSRRGIQDEVNMLQQAHECGVPSPAIILARMDVSRSTTSGLEGHEEKWHVLIMEYLPTGTVTVDQVRAMSLSLVRAVQRLHQHGLLHCDIKPQNLAWDSQLEQVYLLDFGHAQEEQHAKSYRATPWFEAPEIPAKQPHSRASDAYSVGESIKSILGKMPYHRYNDPDSSLVSRVAEGLTRREIEERLTLAKAEELLETDQGQLVAET